MTIATTTAISPPISSTTASATGGGLRSTLQPTLDALTSQFNTTLAKALENAVQKTQTQASAQAPTADERSAGQAIGAPAATPGTQTATVNTAASQPSSGSFQAPWLQGAATAGQYLHQADADHATRHSGKPDTATFMKATGADFSTASSLLYGVIGSNTDYRDWNAIMASDNPALAARQATGAHYNSDLPYTSGQGFKPSASQTLAASGNFAWLQVDSRESLWAMNSQGEALRQLPLSAPDILRASRDFGLDTAHLATLADQMDAKGVAYAPGALAAGSNHGVDLRALAQGGMGAAYDWTSDPLAALKGPGAQDALAANVQLAQELGLTAGATGAARTAAEPVPAASNTASSAKTTEISDTNGLEDIGKQLTETLLAQLQNALKSWQAQNGTAA